MAVDGSADAPGVTPASTDARRKARRDHREALIDSALKETFPASDPPSIAWPPAGDDSPKPDGR